MPSHPKNRPIYAKKFANYAKKIGNFGKKISQLCQKKSANHARKSAYCATIPKKRRVYAPVCHHDTIRWKISAITQKYRPNTHANKNRSIAPKEYIRYYATIQSTPASVARRNSRGDSAARKNEVRASAVENCSTALRDNSTVAARWIISITFFFFPIELRPFTSQAV